MTDKPADKNLFPTLLDQNPAPVDEKSQDRKDKERAQVDRILEVFMRVLPSNYVSQVTGPFYTLQFQAAAERLADFQITAQEVFADWSYEYTRSEFLFQIIGAMVFPDANTGGGWPTIQGDISYRTFLTRMVELLLQGATTSTVKSGIELVTDATIEIIERAIAARTTPNSAWGADDQFTFEINVSNIVRHLDVNAFRDVSIAPIPEDEFEDQSETGDYVDLYGFPDNPFVLQKNVGIILRALKPAHTLYDYRHLFREAFDGVFEDEVSWELSNYYYQDWRRLCLGAKNVIGDNGETLIDRSLFSDPTRDFESISPGATLVVTSGPNSIHSGGIEGTAASIDEHHIGRYRVEEVRAFPVGDDPTVRAYTTTPTGLTGTATVSGDVVEDTNQDWGQALEGEILTFPEGPNAGNYRFKTLMGSYGGPVGDASGPATRVRVASSLLRIRRRMAVAIIDQSYEVEVDRLGRQIPHKVEGEDATLYFVR